MYKKLKFANKRKWKPRGAYEVFNGKTYSTQMVNIKHFIKMLNLMDNVPEPIVTDFGSFIYKIGILEVVFKATQFGDGTYYPYVLSRLINEK